jgi:hypothetical protein
MKLSQILIVGAAVVLGGYVYYDYNSDDSKNARELKELEQLAPDVKPNECFPKGQAGKLFAIAISRDQRPKAELENDTVRKSAIEHDCIRGNQPPTVARVVKALGATGIPAYAEVLEKCPVVKDEYPVYACFAMDALVYAGGPAATAALEKALPDNSKDKVRKNIYLGALYRLMNTPGWKTNAQLAQYFITEQDWKAKELMIEYLRNHKDPAAKPDMEKAWAAETDLQEKGLMKAAILEIENPGKCVWTDEGRSEDGTCHYQCKEQNKFWRPQKPKGGCAPVVDVPQEAPAAAAPPVNAATPAPVPAPAAAAKK